MKKLLLAVALAPFALGFSMANAQTEVTTDPVGFVKSPLNNGSYSLVGVNLTKAAVYGASVESTTANSITVADSAASIEGLLDSGARYYVEVTGGALEGDRIDIASAAGNVITLDTAAPHNTINDTSALPVDSTIVIREHYTFADLGEGIGTDSLHGGTGTANSDQILTFENGSFAVHFLGSDLNWYSGDGSFTVVNGKIIPPGSGVLFYANPAGGERALEVLSLGSVRNNDVVRPLGTGFQIVSTGFPVDLSPADLGMTTDFFTGGTSSANADQILIFENGSFAVHFLGTDNNWYTADGSFTPVTDTDLFAAQGAVLVYRNSADSDFRIANQLQ